jgi:hypothetical protein|tara:strand:+ start:394 stop:612 length:219 start_codon:yes stop_codon:yes gene_type:complete
MDQREWNEIVGGGMTVEDDLLWQMFQARRSIERYRFDRETGEGSYDHELVAINKVRIKDAKVALVALWKEEK